MKQNILENDNLVIIGKIDGTDDWINSIETSQLPLSVFFQVSGFKEKGVTKTVWNVDRETPILTVTNKSSTTPQSIIVSHTYSTNSYDTLVVQVSVYAPDAIHVSRPFSIEFLKAKGKIKKNYIDPSLFREEIVAYYATDELPDSLAVSLNQIATRLAFAPNFINYTYREDMIGDAIIKMFKALREKKFNPKKGNAFSYFTKIAFHAFCNRIKKEKKCKDTLNNYQEETYNNLIDSGYIPHPKHSEQSSEGSNEDS